MPAPERRPESSESTVFAKGSRKGEETRRRILDVALQAFGEEGFAAVSTRRIAEAAAVNLPALRYYFGGKQGLYLACAHEIVGEYQARLQTLQADLAEALQDDMSPDVARASLKAVLRALVDIQIGSQRSEIWLAFVQREISEQGPAFGLLFDSLWAPGVNLAADLISRISGAAGRSEAARLRAVLLVSSFAAFGVARPITLKYLDWVSLDAVGLKRIKQALDEEVDRIR